MRTNQMRESSHLGVLARHGAIPEEFEEQIRAL